MEHERAKLATRSDAQLIRTARSDPEAFRELFVRHARALEGWLYARTHDPNASVELSQRRLPRRGAAHHASATRARRQARPGSTA